MQDTYNELLNTFTEITNKDEMRKFLGEILTDKERESVALRWQVLKGLNAGKSQRDIAKEYHMSLCKITRGSKILKNNESICKKFINKYNKDN